MFAGYTKLGSAFVSSLLTKNVNETPTNIDGGTQIAWKVYGPAGVMVGGQGVATKLDTVPGLYRYSIPATGENGYEVGKLYRVIFTYTVNGTTVGQDHAFIVT